MPQTDPTGAPAPSGGFKDEGWYGGYHYKQGTFAPVAGQLHPLLGGGEAYVAPKDVAYIEQERLRADQIQAPTQISLPTTTTQGDFITGLTSEVDIARTALEKTLATQKAAADAKLEALRTKEKETLKKVGKLVTPFREDLETAERERLFIDENFEANQVLINELDQLLTEGNELIRQQKEVTGLAAVRNPRIQKAMDDVAARAGVIEAVINARNGQIAVAENMIDRTISAITGDRRDQIAYYEVILDLNRRDILSLDTESKKIAEEQLKIKKTDLENAQKIAEYVKTLLVDPGTAGLMGEGGVKLTDSIDTINAKLTRATYAREVRDISNAMALEGAEAVFSPKGVPAGELRTITDSRGKKHYYRVREEPIKETAGEKKEIELQQTTENLIGDIQRGATLEQLIGRYTVPGGLTVGQVYRLYNIHSPYLEAKETLEEVKEGRFIT